MVTVAGKPKPEQLNFITVCRLGQPTAWYIGDDDDQESIDQVINDPFPFIDEFGDNERDGAHNQRDDGQKFHETQHFHFHAALADRLIRGQR